MPRMTGPELHDQLCQRRCNLPVIYLTANGTVSIGVNAMRRGAFDFLEKPIDADALLPVVNAALTQCKKALAEKQHLDDILQRVAELSPREREVMDHVIEGRLNKQNRSVVEHRRQDRQGSPRPRDVENAGPLCRPVGPSLR